MVLAVTAWLKRGLRCTASAVIPAAIALSSRASAEPANGEAGEPSGPQSRTSDVGVRHFELENPTWKPQFVDGRTYTGFRLHLDVASLERPRLTQRALVRDTALRLYWEEWMASATDHRLPTRMHLWPESTLTARAVRQFRYGSGTDERSAWARWHSTLWGTSASLGIAMIATVGTLSLLPRDVSGWKSLDFYGLKKNFTSGPNFDYDHAFFNYIAHPYDGSEFYLLARNRDCTWWESFAYGVAVSTAFEFMIESAYEGASWQDLWITPVSGAVIGELRWQAKKGLEDPKTGKPVGTVKKILHVLVDPVDALLNL